MSDETMSDERKDAADKIVPFRPRVVKDARDLEVFKRAYKLSLEVHKVTLDFPKIEQYALGDQLRRSSKSICANIAEGFGKQSYSSAEFGRFLAMAEGSATEVQVWLQYAHDLSYITAAQFAQWEDDCSAVKSMLYKLRKRL